ncbi:hypothetical protein [Polyangium sorediatum]|uniref:Uncharacterized protein n=1 Tax=Polyangium sorediatum TaxID=889274 RepID=A0ABT6P453_9BACT|nr:hypothetical protein [Polyangium sorediatum]MDI1435387.1 hypothetical protein [Polyangium sorediatum]
MSNEAQTIDDTTEAPELTTEFAIGSDGHLYVSAESLPPGALAGRKQFVGYELTSKEARQVWETLHRLAFNATQPLRARR